MDLDKIPPTDLGRSLSGVGINLLTADVRRLAQFLAGCFGLEVHRLSDDFAIIRQGSTLIQLHSDGAFGAHPLLGLVPETPPRGAGAQFYLFGIDPDLAAARAGAAGGEVIEAPTDKPHGLHTATILSPEGFAFSPAVARQGEG